MNRNEEKFNFLIFFFILAFLSYFPPFLHFLNCHYKMIASLNNHIQQLKVKKKIYINKLPFEV